MTGMGGDSWESLEVCNFPFIELWSEGYRLMGRE